MPRLIALILVFALSLQARAVSSYALEKCDWGLSLNSHEFLAAYSLLVVECEHGWDVIVIDERVRVGEPLGYVDGMSLYNGYFSQWGGVDPSGEAYDPARARRNRISREGGGSRSDISDAISGIDSAIDGLRMIGGLPISILSGDISYVDNEPVFSGGGCEFLITINGIWNNYDGGRALRDAIRDSDSYSHVDHRNISFVHNPTHLLGIGDFIQIIGDEIGFINITSIRAANHIEEAARQAEENGCCDYVINVVGHSQGTSVFYRALHLIDDDIRSHIEFVGIGGQRFISQSASGLRSAINLPNWGDFVPYVNYLPHRWLRLLQDADVRWDHSPNSHSILPIDHSWLPHYINRFNR